MGEHTQKKGSKIPVQSGHPGCMWSVILHVIQYQHWHNVTKGLPHRRHGCNRHTKSGENPRNKKASNAGKLHEAGGDQVNSSDVQEMRQATPAHKNSVRARIKSLISEEFSKRKGRHRRSSTCPVKSELAHTPSIHNLEASYKDSPPKSAPTDASPETANESNEDSRTTTLMDSLLEKSFDETIASEETADDCQAMLTRNDLGHTHDDENKTQLMENNMLLQENLGHAKQASFKQKLINNNDLIRDASLCQSKEFLDALDIFNSNKDFFLKVLHGPNSPLAQHFHNQQTLSTRMGLTKSETFPLPGLSGKRVPGPSKLKHKQDAIRSCEKEEGKLKVVGQAQNSMECESIEDICKQSMALDRVDEIRKENKAVADIGDSSSSGSAHNVQNPFSNQVAIKCFKDLKQKIKHVIKESENERHRIAMDAVLHKVPHNQGFSKDLKNDIFEKLKDSSSKVDAKDSPPSSSQCDRKAHIRKRLHRMRRTSSVNETLDRYCQLYQFSVNREAKEHISGTLKLKRSESVSPPRSTCKSLGRILSLPDLKSYFNQSEDLFDAISSWMPARIPVEGTVSMSSLGEQNSRVMPIASEYCSQLDNPAGSQIQEDLVEVSDKGSGTGDQGGSTSTADNNAEEDKLSGDMSNLITRDSASDNSDPKATEQSEPSPVAVLDFDFKEVGESTAEFSVSEELEENLGFLLPGKQESLISHHGEYSMDTPRVAHNSEFEKVEFPSNQVASEIPYVQVDAKDKGKFDYVKYILELSGFSRKESLGTWHSDYQPVDPSIYEEVEGCILLDPDCSANEDGTCNHIIIFDLINEVLMEIYERSFSYYPSPLSSLCRIHIMPSGNHVLKEVWANISWYLSLRPELDQSLDYVASMDLSKNDGWMNMQFSSECVGLEVEDLLFEELLEEVIFS